jgi:hypothetical protein
MSWCIAPERCWVAEEDLGGGPRHPTAVAGDLEVTPLNDLGRSCSLIFPTGGGG